MKDGHHRVTVHIRKTELVFYDWGSQRRSSFTLINCEVSDLVNILDHSRAILHPV